MSNSIRPQLLVLSPQCQTIERAAKRLRARSIDGSPLIIVMTHHQHQQLKQIVSMSELSADQSLAKEQIYYILSAPNQMLSTAVAQAKSKKLEQIDYLANDWGFFTANPSLLPNAKLIKYLDYSEAKEMLMALQGEMLATDIDLLRQCNLTLHYQTLQSEKSQGTMISHRSETDAPQIKMLTVKQDVTTVSIASNKMARRPGFLAQIFSCFSALNLSIDHLATSEDCISMTVDNCEKQNLEEKLQELQQLLSPMGNVSIHSARSTLSILGNKVKSSWHKMSESFSLLEEHPVYLMSYSAADVNLSLVLDSNQAIRLMKTLHAELIEGDIINPIFGESLAEIQGEEKTNKMSETQLPWWFERRSELEVLGQQSNYALYVYNLPTVRERAKQLKKLKSIDHVLFAIKANNNSEILKTVEAEGHGFECVSLQEVEHVLSTFPNIDRKRILFTPNFSPRAEYQQAIKYQVNLTLDSTYPLEMWPEVFANQEIFVRIDTGIGKGHHHYVHTAGNQSKFGVPPQEIEKLLTLCHQHHVRIVGLHAHAGSGILSADAWSKVGNYLFGILPKFPHVKVIDLGGGLGVPIKIGQDSLALEQVESTLAIFKQNAPEIKLWMEPGRFFVAEAGVIIAQVTQVKKKGDVQYVGINTGMNSLIRPALYGAHHEIKNISRLEDHDNYIANVVGPICESGDVLGHSRPLPRSTKSGDIILIGNAGAYGRVMSSHYTMRAPAVEVTLK